MSKRPLTQDEVQLLEAIDGMDRLGIRSRDCRDMSAVVDSLMPDGGSSFGGTYHDIIQAYKSLERRGYVRQFQLTDLGLSVTTGSCNPSLKYADGKVYRKCRRRNTVQGSQV